MSKQVNRPSDRARARRERAKAEKSSAPFIILFIVFIGLAGGSYFLYDTLLADQVKKKKITKAKVVKKAPKVSPKTSTTQWWKNKDNHRARLTQLLDQESDYSNLAQQKKHSLGGMKSTKEEIQAFPFLLGPTGIYATKNIPDQSYTVTTTSYGSPAYGKVKEGDIIIGANGKKFSSMTIPEDMQARSPNYQMATLIMKSESELNGKLSLQLKNGKKVQIKLSEVGGFHQDDLDKCPKIDYLAELNARILAAKQRPDGTWSPGFSNNSKGKLYTTCAVAMALMSTGDSKYDPEIKKAGDYIIETYSKRGINSFGSWAAGHINLFLGEFYLRYNDKRALPIMKMVAEQAIAGAFYYNGMWGWGHGLPSGNYRYGGINVCTAEALAGIGMAKACGIELPEDRIYDYARLTERLAPDGYLGYSYARKRKGETRTHVKHNEDAGRTGTLALATKLLGGTQEQYKRLTDFMFINGDHAECGHSTAALSLFWAHAAMANRGGRQFDQYLKERLFYITLNRQFDGGFYLQPGVHNNQFRTADGSLGPNYMAAAMLIMLNARKQAIFITGKDYSEHLEGPVYQDSDRIASSAQFYLRRDRVVEIAEVINRLGKRKKPPVELLYAKLNKIDLDDKEFDYKASGIYEKYLKSAVQSVMNDKKIDNDTKADLAMTLIGLNYSATSCNIGSNGKASFRHTYVTPNNGSLKISSLLKEENSNGVKLKSKTKWHSKDITPLESGREKDRSTVKLKFDGEPGEKFTLPVITYFEWEGIKFSKKTTLSFPSEGPYGKWSPSPEETRYGPFKGEVLKCTNNGSLQVRITKDVIHESSMMNTVRIHMPNGSTISYDQFRQKHTIEEGSTIRYSYFNRGGSPFTPMCSDIWLN